MKKMNLTCLMAALLLWLGSLAQAQAAAQPPSFAQRCDGWITSNDFFNQEKFERWGKKFDSQPEFKQWLTTLAPKHQARQEKSPMNDDDFNAWLTAEVLAKTRHALFQARLSSKRIYKLDRIPPNGQDRLVAAKTADSKLTSPSGNPVASRPSPHRLSNRSNCRSARWQR